MERSSHMKRGREMCSDSKSSLLSEILPISSYRSAVHDSVRDEAVAPKSKWMKYLKRPHTTHADVSLSESDEEKPRKIRSYIKPNKNINTFKRKLHDDQTIAKIVKHKLKTDGKPRASSSSQIRRAPPHVASGSIVDKKFHNYSSTNVMKSHANEIMDSPSYFSSPSSSVLQNAAFGHRVKKSTFHASSSSANSHIDKKSYCAFPIQEKASSLSDSRVTAHGEKVPEKTSAPARSAVMPKEKWNEHLNLVYLYKRGAKIFTLDNLPPEELWYREAFVVNECFVRKHPGSVSGQTNSKCDTKNLQK